MLTISLFLALRPDRYSATQLTDLANELRAKYKLKGTPTDEFRLHVSLYRLDDSGGLSVASLGGLGAAIEEMVAIVPPFEVIFDRVMSFSRSGALVVYSRQGNTALNHFREGLMMVLENCGIRCKRSRFRPHVTLLYDEHYVDDPAIDPVSWVVNDLLLIYSVRGTYHFLKRWELRG